MTELLDYVYFLMEKNDVSFKILENYVKWSLQANKIDIKLK